MSTPPRAYTPYGEGVDLTRDLLTRSPLPKVIFQDDQVILFVNQAFERVFGYSRDEIVGKPYDALFPPRLQADLRQRVADYLSEPEPESIAFRPDYLAMRKDGTEFPMQYEATTIVNRHGRWVVVTVFDVSAAREAAAKIERLTRFYRALARMNQAVVRAGDVPTLYEQTCQVAVDDGGFLAAWVGEPGPEGRIRPVAQAGALGDYVDELVITTDPALPTSHGPTGRAFAEGVLVYSDDFERDPGTGPWRDAAARHSIGSSVSLPLRRGGAPVAVLSLYADHPHAFEDTADLLTGLAGNVSHALDGLAQAELLSMVSAQREDLLRRLVDAQEAERRRLAADIHDEPIQRLAAVDLRLGVLERAVRDSRDDWSQQLRQTRELLGETITTLRELMFELEPPDEQETLEDTLREAAGHVFHGHRIEVSVQAEDVRLGHVSLSQAIRVVKEALINVRKHSGAHQVEIRARRSGAGAYFTISDDGTGLEPRDGSPSPGHRGLRTMAERAELAGGWLRTGASGLGGAEVGFWLPDKVGAD